jgi:hypothetical protein
MIDVGVCYYCLVMCVVDRLTHIVFRPSANVCHGPTTDRPSYEMVMRVMITPPTAQHHHDNASAFYGVF